jgi:hypothetical protein
VIVIVIVIVIVFKFVFDFDFVFVTFRAVEFGYTMMTRVRHEGRRQEKDKGNEKNKEKDKTKTRQFKDKILIGLDPKMKLDCKGHNIFGSNPINILSLNCLVFVLSFSLFFSLPLSFSCLLSSGSNPINIHTDKDSTGQETPCDKNKTRQKTLKSKQEKAKTR